MITREEFDKLVEEAIKKRATIPDFTMGEVLDKLWGEAQKSKDEVLAAWDEMVAENGLLKADNKILDTTVRQSALIASNRLIELDQVTAWWYELVAENEAQKDRLDKIIEWCDAYPLDIFPEPDFIKVRAALEEKGITLGAVSASNMRHVVDGVKRIAKGEVDE